MHFIFLLLTILTEKNTCTRYRYVVSPYYNKNFKFTENCTFCACQGNCPVVNAGPIDERYREFSELLVRNAVVEAGVLNVDGSEKVLMNDYTQRPYDPENDIIDYVMCGGYIDIPCSKKEKSDESENTTLKCAINKFSENICERL